jgi:hypothetical protein
MRNAATRAHGTIVRSLLIRLALIFSIMAVATGVVPHDPVAFASATTPCRTDAAVVTCTFVYNGGKSGSNGSVQTFVVPKAVTDVTVEAWGAQGGDTSGALGGPGGLSRGSLPVSPGSSLQLRVGGTPTGASGGYNGGGTAGVPGSGYTSAAGGGATDVRMGGGALADRVIVAGGGGGSAYSTSVQMAQGQENGGLALGGAGGGSAGSVSTACEGSPWQSCGGGATSAAGGAAGATTGSPCGSDGVLGTGGSGCGGGGGGGYYGGGSGGYFSGTCCGLTAEMTMDGPGGGGSGFVTTSATDVAMQPGLEFGNGMVRISYAAPRIRHGLTWSPPTPIDTTGASVTGISCTSSTFCVAVDSGGNAAVYSGAWSSFSAVAGSGNDFTSVSCASPTLCVAVGTAPVNSHFDQDLAVVYDGNTWSPNESVSVSASEILTSVSCAPGTTFCEAVGWTAAGGPGDQMIVETYENQNWNAMGGDIGYGTEGDKFLTVSCASAKYCVAGGIVQDRSDIGDFLSIADHGKTGGGQITNVEVDGIQGAIDASSCGGTSCVAAGDGDLTFSVKGTTWSGPHDPDGSATINALSCSGNSVCVGVDNNGDAITDFSGTWTAPVPIDAKPLTALSCPTKEFCAAVDSAGDVVFGSG